MSNASQGQPRSMSTMDETPSTIRPQEQQGIAANSTVASEDEPFSQGEDDIQHQRRELDEVIDRFRSDAISKSQASLRSSESAQEYRTHKRIKLSSYTSTPYSRTKPRLLERISGELGKLDQGEDLLMEEALDTPNRSMTLSPSRILPDQAPFQEAGPILKV